MYGETRPIGAVGNTSSEGDVDMIVVMVSRSSVAFEDNEGADSVKSVVIELRHAFVVPLADVPASLCYCSRDRAAEGSGPLRLPSSGQL